MTILREWILGIVGAAILSGVVIGLAPKGKWTGVMTLICGFLLLYSLINPLFRLDFENLAGSIVDYTRVMGEYGAELENEGGRLMAKIIEQEAAEYILDKAAKEGIPVEEVFLTSKLDADGCPYPYAAEIRGELTDAQRDSLAARIEGELGIKRERLSWT